MLFKLALPEKGSYPMSQKVTAVATAIAETVVTAVREFTLASYRISQPSTPEFLIGAPYVAPSDPRIVALSQSDKEEDREKVVFKVAGTIRRTYDGVQDAQNQSQKFLPVNAEKYAHSAFTFTQEEDGAFTITLPIFKKGPIVKVPVVKKDAPAMVGLLALSKKVPTAAVEASETVTTTETGPSVTTTA